MESDEGIFAHPDVDRKLALKMDDGRLLWVSRETLSMFSPVFKAMLYGRFEEADKDKIPLPGKKSEDIEQLMLFLHQGLLSDGGNGDGDGGVVVKRPCRRRRRDDEIVTESNLESMMSLAEEYEIDALKSYAEQCLINRMDEIVATGKSAVGLLPVLRFGSKYRFKKLLFECIRTYGPKLKFPKLHQLSPELPSEIVTCLTVYMCFCSADSGKCCFMYKRDSLAGNCSSRCYAQAVAECTLCNKIVCESCMHKTATRICASSHLLAVQVKAILDKM